MNPELSVIIPTHRRNAKLRTLIDSLGATATDHDAFEIVVIVDGEDDEPLKTAEQLPESISFRGLTKPHGGPAAARNFAIEHARGDWIVFYDDDTRVDAHAIPGHLKRIRRDRNTRAAHLGTLDWPEELIDSPWRQLLAESSMLFFWDQMIDGQAYGFRHFWTNNLSVRRDLVLDVGGFNEGFPSPMHEDIELGWRLQDAFGTQMFVDRSIVCLHDHALDPADYLRREFHSGRSARSALEINPAFHDQVWPWIHDAPAQLDGLNGMFARSAAEVLQMLRGWAEPSDLRLGRSELETAYHAHLPLKRIAFLEGYLGRGFDDFWTRMT